MDFTILYFTLSGKASSFRCFNTNPTRDQGHGEGKDTMRKIYAMPSWVGAPASPRPPIINVRWRPVSPESRL